MFMLTGFKVQAISVRADIAAQTVWLWLFNYAQNQTQWQVGVAILVMWLTVSVHAGCFRMTFPTVLDLNGFVNGDNEVSSLSSLFLCSLLCVILYTYRPVDVIRVNRERKSCWISIKTLLLSISTRSLLPTPLQWMPHPQWKMMSSAEKRWPSCS